MSQVQGVGIHFLLDFTDMLYLPLLLGSGIRHAVCPSGQWELALLRYVCCCGEQGCCEGL